MCRGINGSGGAGDSLCFLTCICVQERGGRTARGRTPHGQANAAPLHLPALEPRSNIYKPTAVIYRLQDVGFHLRTFFYECIYSRVLCVYFCCPQKATRPNPHTAEQRLITTAYSFNYIPFFILHGCSIFIPFNYAL